MPQITIIKKAFSLIELSIVFIIIGLLIAGIVAGSSLIKATKLSSARSTTLAAQIVTIPGMVLWLEPSTKDSFLTSQAVDGTSITTWYNIEPSNFLVKNNLTAAASSDVTYKDASINDLPSVNITTAGKMSLANFSGSALAQSTIVVVFRPTVAISTTALNIIDSSSSSLTSSIAIKSDAVVLNAGTSVTTSTTTNPASFVKDNDYILMVNFNGENSKVFVNNIVGASAVLNANINTLSGLTVGTDKTGSNGIAAEISEVIVYNRTLKDTERQDVMSYLMAKYKINVVGI